MKKRIMFAVVMAMALSLVFGSATMAGPPIVSVSAVSPGGGSVVITATGIDASTWHPGAVGQVNNFTASGEFTVQYDAYAGSYGSLQTYVNASSTLGATFTMTDAHDFNILSANHNYNTTGVFYARATGVDAEMNLKSIGSMYVWSEATNPYSQPALQGSYIEKDYQMYTSSVLTATMNLTVVTTGSAHLHNSNIWGFGGWEDGSISTNYGSKTSGNIRTVHATGAGSATQYISAINGGYSDTSGVVDGAPIVAVDIDGVFAATTVTNFLTSLDIDYSMYGK